MSAPTRRREMLRFRREPMGMRDVLPRGRRNASPTGRREVGRVCRWVVRIWEVLPHTSSVTSGDSFSSRRSLRRCRAGAATSAPISQIGTKQNNSDHGRSPYRNLSFVIYNFELKKEVPVAPLFYCFQRTKDVLRVQLHASPGSRIAAAGFSSHLMELPSALGRLCQGSMQTNLGVPGLDHSST